MLKPFALLAALALAGMAFAAAAEKNGSLDLPETKAAASAIFDKLDAGHSGAVSDEALKGRIVKKDMPALDPSRKHVVSRETFLTYVEALFKVADIDGGGTLDAKELRSPAGRKLQKLLK